LAVYRRIYDIRLPRTGISSGTLCSVIEYGLPLHFFTRREKTFASRERCEVSVTSPSRQTTTSTLSAKRACRSRSRIAFGRLRPVPEDWSVYGKTSFKVKWWVGYLMITFPTAKLLNYTQSLQSFASIDGTDRQTDRRSDGQTDGHSTVIETLHRILCE